MRHNAGTCLGMFRRKQQCVNASETNQKNRPFGLWYGMWYAFGM